MPLGSVLPTVFLEAMPTLPPRFQSASLFAAQDACSKRSRGRVPVSQALEACFVGSLCLSVNRKERVRISADLLWFVGGVRCAGHPLGGSKEKDVLVLYLEPDSGSIGRWTSPAMMGDEYGEWEAFQSIDDLKLHY